MNTLKSDTVTEHTLWDNFLSGDNAAYAMIYKRYVTDLYKYGMYFTTDEELVKDCIQDIFTRIYKNRSSQGKVDNIKAYLLFAMKNSLFNAFKKERKLYHLDSVEPVFSVDYSMEDQIIEEEEEKSRKRKMHHILELLTPPATGSHALSFYRLPEHGRDLYHHGYELSIRSEFNSAVYKKSKKHIS